MTDQGEPPQVERRDPAQAATRRRLEDLVALRTRQLAVAKDAAEAALAAKGAFLARMSHEIRTPMNTIIGLNHIMLRDVAEPRLRRQIGRVLGAAEQLLGLIDDILDLSRLEAGQVRLAERDFAARQLIDDVGRHIAPQLAAKGLELEVDAAPELPRLLRGDAGRIRQVLLNFATNAVKFTERGFVRVSAAVVESAGNPVRIRFSVADSGIGLTEEQCQRVFQAFEQGDGGIARKFGGTGLGLALCARLAQLLHGTVAVASVPGVGSTFSLEVPLVVAEVAARRDPTAAATTTVAPGDPGNLRVLLVDDNELNLEVAAALLQILGYEADLARDGIEAIARARQRSYAAILIDVQMPRMDGLEATRQLRRIPNHVHTPIIAMTASVFEEDRESCLEAGMDDLVSKPVDPRLLAQALQRWAPHAASIPLAPGAGAASPVAAPAGPLRVRDWLLELQRLLDADDLDAREYFHSLSAGATGFGPELARAIDDFDFARASVLVAGLLEALDAGPEER